MRDETLGVRKLRQAIDEVAAGLPPVPIATGRREPRPGLAALLGGAAATLVLAYPAFLGLTGGGDPGAGRPAAPDRPLAAVRIVPLPRPELRSTTLAPPIELAEASGLPLVLIVELDPRWLGGEPAEASFRLDVEATSGATVGSWVFSARELRRIVDQEEGVPLLLAPGRLSAGDYRLRLERRQGAIASEIASRQLRIAPRPSVLAGDAEE